MCGADALKTRIDSLTSGSPPRVRSRRTSPVPRPRRVGITSACAEQTATVWKASCASGDHLRVCGADFLLQNGLQRESGSPPRVRSRLQVQTMKTNDLRITSACAEQTQVLGSLRRLSWDHLRVCGADYPMILLDGLIYGSPPRVRSRPQINNLSNPNLRITSACAEQTVPPNTPWNTTGDHLRVCGADSCILLCSEPAEWRGIFDLRTA